jgi:hypothetical protein
MNGDAPTMFMTGINRDLHPMFLSAANKDSTTRRDNQRFFTVELPRPRMAEPKLSRSFCDFL